MACYINLNEDVAAPVDDLKEQQPVFYAGLPALMWKNLFQAYCVKGVIDLSAGDGEICKAAMQLRKPCLAFCLSDMHVRLLFDHLVSWMLTHMADETSVYYNANYVKYKALERAGGEAAAAPPPTLTPVKDKKKRGSEGGEGKPKKKPKKKESEDESSSSADEQ
jgi:hypothetical protein